MKKLAFLIALTLSIFITQANENKKIYSRVKIQLENRDLTELAELGIALQANEFKAGQFFTGEFSSSELKIISEAGFEYEILIHDMTQYYQSRNKGINKDSLMREIRIKTKDTEYPTPENFTLGSMGGYHTFSEMIADLDLMHELYPELISEKAAISETMSIEGRPIYWVRISNSPQETTDKPKVLYTALTHAREPASLQQMLFQMWYLLENYGSNPEITYLIDNLEMYFVPCVNPDGYVFCETTEPDGGALWRKNRRLNGDGSYGVDLNRNFGYMWGYDNSGSSPSPSAATYRGTEGFSEPETQSIKEFAETYDFTLALNNHTYSDLLIYPWGYENLLTPDSLVFIEYAKLLTEENAYIYGTVYETLSYFANGGSDDWFYGEQETKNKVLAFTPEAGSPIDGFWPSIDKIVDICAGHVHMNNSLAHLALPYAKTKSIDGLFVENIQTDVGIEIINLGQYSPANFTVSLQAITDNIIATGSPVSFDEMEVLEKDTGYISIELAQSVKEGDIVQYILQVDNGLYVNEEIITRYYGTPEVVFFDPCDDLTHWTSSKWDISEVVYFSPPGSIADSPGTNYSDYSNEEIVLSEPINLNDAIIANLSFRTRFDIEKNWDYVQVFISTNNQQSWEPLAGKYTQPGSENQAVGQPLYHGEMNNWVLEEIDLSEYIGNEIWIKYRIISDSYVNAEGYYFDDFTVSALNAQEDDDDDDVSIINNNINNDCSIFYSSNTGNLIIQIPEEKNHNNINVKISDISGRLLFSKNYRINSTLRIPLTNYFPGIYIATIRGDINVSKKIVIIK